MDEHADVLERALGYPYAIPLRSFDLLGGRRLEPGAIGVDLSARIPVLAYGSNASPTVLAGKLGADPEPVAVRRAALRDLDVVYSAHLSSYGAVPATLQRSPGTETAVFVAYLTRSQLASVSATEPNYELKPLRAATCRLGSGEPVAALAYFSRHGCLLADGSEVALAAVAARRRRYPAMSQAEVLEQVRGTVCPERSLRQLVHACCADSGLACSWTQRLARRPFAAPAQTFPKRRRAKRAIRP